MRELDMTRSIRSPHVRQADGSAETVLTTV